MSSSSRKEPEEEKDGNYYFTAGGFRFVHAGLVDVCGDVLVYLSEQSVRRPSAGPRPRPFLGTAHACDAPPVG